MEGISEKQIKCIFQDFNRQQENTENKENQNNSNSHTYRISAFKKNKNLQEQKPNTYKPKPYNKLPSLSFQGLQNCYSSVRKNGINEKKTSRILKQGYLLKKNDSIFFNWKKFYFVLNSEKLLVYETEMKEKILTSINFRLLKANLKFASPDFIFDFQGQCPELILKTKDKVLYGEWKKVFEKVILHNFSHKKIMLRTFAKSVYEEKDVISENQFVFSAETGDILLFHTKNTGAKLQRFFTNSDYDHVAMIVKPSGQYEPTVFQSNFNYGVSVYEWKKYIKYFNLYERVSLRKLNHNNNKILQQLVNFVKKNVGKKYDLTARKILKLESDFDWNEVRQEEERGYFCSQLIAKAYKSAGLLNEKKSCGRYWPVDFSEKNQLLLKNGAWLGSQQTIVLNKHLKNKI